MSGVGRLTSLAPAPYSDDMSGMVAIDRGGTAARSTAVRRARIRHRALPPVQGHRNATRRSRDVSSDDSGSSAGIGFVTARGRQWPTLRQFTVFLENRVGQLLDVVRRFDGSRVRIVALSINDSGECAFVRFLVSHPDQGREILERAGLPLIESDLIGVELAASQQPLLQVCTALLQAEVNIIQAYPIMVRPRGRPAVALMVDNTEMGLETLGRKGFTMISESDLDEDD